MGELKWKKGLGALDCSSLEGLVEDYEGNIQPASQPYFKVKEMAEGVWQILTDGDYSYLLEGDDEMILVDAGMGAGNLREMCQAIRPGKPLYRMLLTHNHGDHIVNCYQFDAVYMSRDVYDGRGDFFLGFENLDIPIDYPVVFLKDGDVINLAGRPLEVLAIDEHCKGSLQFLDRKSGILFCGDELNGNFFDSQISVEHSYRNLKRWASLRDSYHTLAAGNGIHDASYVDKYLKIAEYILSGHENEGEKYYEPYEDDPATVHEIDGVPVRHRRTDFSSPFWTEPFIAAGCGEYLKYNHGRFCFCFMRKMSPNGEFDRQLTMDGARFCYFLNRIWDK